VFLEVESTYTSSVRPHWGRIGVFYQFRGGSKPYKYLVKYLRHDLGNDAARKRKRHAASQHEQPVVLEVF
jgi:hypothetical protein